jgi:hypothetical protein
MSLISRCVPGNCRQVDTYALELIHDNSLFGVPDTNEKLRTAPLHRT